MNDLILMIDKIFGRYAIFARYLFSGGTAFATNVVVLYILTEYVFGIEYLMVSVVLAFLIAFIVSFLMMKHVTFQDGQSEKIHRQLVVYFAVAIFNLFLNSFLVLFFTQNIGIWYIFSQVMSSLIIAIWNFFIYKYLIFTKPISETIQ